MSTTDRIVLFGYLALCVFLWPTPTWKLGKPDLSGVDRRTVVKEWLVVLALVLASGALWLAIAFDWP